MAFSVPVQCVPVCLPLGRMVNGRRLGDPGDSGGGAGMLNKDFQKQCSGKAPVTQGIVCLSSENSASEQKYVSLYRVICI